ncbi:MAG: ABC transporter substrate-binding protein [Kiritimatiellae bacterium]|jgi:iron complex transport system substrate-binding protein|nr:ABC transporter substrate-binding protein [Kiritimatiellia bacterium]
MLLKRYISILLLLLCTGCKPNQTKVRSSEHRDARVISTAPALTEIICAIGASVNLVGRTDACDYPPELIQSIEIAGKFASPNIEQVLKMQPTHLLESFLVDPLKKTTIEKFGIKVEHIPCSRMCDIPAAIRRIGEITTHEESAEELAVSIEKQLIEAAQINQLSSKKYRTLLLFDHNTPVTCATNTFVSELTELAGGKNIADMLTREYDSISLEWIVKQDPELIICFYKIGRNPIEIFKNRAGWQQIKAVKEKRVIVPSDLDIICRPGPRVIEGIRELRKCIREE